MNKKKDLVKALLELGVRGRWLMVHSSYKSVAPFEDGPAGVLDALIKAVGKDGLLLIPAFNFNSWTEKGMFSKSHTPSEMGAMTSIALDDARFERSAHPIYSFSVWPRLLWVGHEPENAFDRCSVFGQFYHMNGIVLNLGVKRSDENVPFPLIHFAEQMVDAKHREYKPWTGQYVTSEVSFRTYGMTVRKEGILTRVKPAMDELTDMNVLRELKICGADCQAAEAIPFVNTISRIYRETQEKLYAKETSL